MRTEHRVFALATVAAFAVLAALPPRLAAQAAPAGATFKCKDGTYSTATTPRGACSRHGGVAEAVRAPRAARAPEAPEGREAPAAAATGAAPAGAKFKCKDGTFSTAASPRGACSRHGGVAEALGAAPAARAAEAPEAGEAQGRERAARAPAAAAGPAPANATALCKDGTYSMSQTRRGTCSRHGGVQQWLKEPPNK